MTVASKRNYRKEYDNYHGTAKQRKRRSDRVLSRRKMVKTGKVSKGDGKDVDHKNGNTADKSAKNLRVQSKKTNRSYARTKTAGKAAVRKKVAKKKKNKRD